MKPNKLDVLFVDPMSYNNLTLYDYNLLSNIQNIKYSFIGNIDFDTSLPIKINRLFNYNRKKSIFKVISYILSQIRVLFIIFKTKPRIVHYQWLKIPLFDLFLFFIIKSCTDVKIVYTAHNVLPHDSGERHKSVYLRLYRIVDSIICHTSSAKDEFKKVFGISNKISVIPHGLLDLDDLDSEKSSDNDIVDSFNLNNEIVFSFLGNLSEYKGIDFLIKAWINSKILSENRDVRLIIAGSGNVNELVLLEKMSNVTIINRYLSNEEFSSIINVSDYILLPYRKIAQSGLLLSVLSKNKKIIVSNLDGLVEPFRVSQDIGFIMQDIDAYALQLIMDKIISQDLYKTKMSDKDWDRVHEFYSWSNIGKKTSSLYNDLMV